MFSEKKFFIAGVQHHDLQKVIADIEVEDVLDLVPEPTNKFDPNAVRIEYMDTMLGYVPKRFSAEIAGALEIDEDLQCYITKLDEVAKPWEMIEVVVGTFDIVEEEIEGLDSDPEED